MQGTLLFLGELILITASIMACEKNNLLWHVKCKPFYLGWEEK